MSHESQTSSDTRVFGRQQLLHNIPRNVDDERMALTYLNRRAPDLIGMILGGVL